MKTILILFFAYLLFQNQNVKINTDISDQEYKIYSIIIDSLYRFPSTKIIVICDSTNKDYFLERSDIYSNGIDSLYLKIVIKGFNLPDSNYIYNDYMLKNSKKYMLSEERFYFNINLSFVSKRKIKTIFESKLVDGWQEFYEQYPNSTGFIELTRIGFNESNDRAIVYVENYCGGLCGEGHYLLLEKKENNWKIIKRKGIWVS